MDFGQKKYFMKLIYLISRVFWAWTFLIFLAYCVTLSTFSKTPRAMARHHAALPLTSSLLKVLLVHCTTWHNNYITLLKTAGLVLEELLALAAAPGGADTVEG